MRELQLEQALKNLLETPDLNLENLEPATITAIDKANSLLENIESFYNLIPVKKTFRKSLREVTRQCNLITPQGWSHEKFYENNNKKYSIFEYNHSYIVPASGGYFILNFDFDIIY